MADSGVEKPIDKSKQRKPRRTPWAIYNPQWIKTSYRTRRVLDRRR